MAVGKSSIIQRLIHNRFDEQMPAGYFEDDFYIYYEKDIFFIFFDDFFAQEMFRPLASGKYPL